MIVKAMQKLITIDCQYVLPRFAAAYLMIDGDRALFVENNTSYAVPHLIEALRKEGMRPEQVDYAIVTHVHLDHAGGSSELMKACPNAKLIAHPRAASHLIDPSKLVGSAKKVYGEEVFRQLYGEISPIDASRVQAMQDGEELEFGSRKLRFIHTRGHANHHFCIYDPITNGIFTGDSFGLAYPDLQRKKLFIVASTSPTDFDPEEARISFRKILDTGADKAYLTHFDQITGLKDASLKLTRQIDFSQELVENALRDSLPDLDLQRYCEEKLRHFTERSLEEAGVPNDEKTWSILKMDLELNAAGIAHRIRKLRTKK